MVNLQRRLVLGCFVLVIWAGTGVDCANAQEPKPHAPPTEKDKESEAAFEFWSVRAQQQPAAAAEMVGIGHPLTIALMRREGKRLLVWREPEFAGDTALPLDPALLRKIRDRTGMPDIAKPKVRPDEQAAYDLFNDAVIQAHNTPVEAFIKSGEDNTHLTFGHLYNEPARHRGKVVPVEGRLKRLRKYDAPEPVQEAGIQFVYEGWVFGPTTKAPPFCIVFTTLPEGMKEAEKMDQPIAFNGYFIKLLRYPTDEKTLDTPMLIGPAIIRMPAPPAPPEKGEAGTPFPIQALLWVGGLIVVAFGLLIYVQWHFRRGDRAFQERLAQIHADRAQQMIEQVTQGIEPEPHKPPGADLGLGNGIKRE